jgi:hypothetical protein
LNATPKIELRNSLTSPRAFQELHLSHRASARIQSWGKELNHRSFDVSHLKKTGHVSTLTQASREAQLKCNKVLPRLFAQAVTVCFAFKLLQVYLDAVGSM